MWWKQLNMAERITIAWARLEWQCDSTGTSALLSKSRASSRSPETHSLTDPAERWRSHGIIEGSACERGREKEREMYRSAVTLAAEDEEWWVYMYCTHWIHYSPLSSPGALYCHPASTFYTQTCVRAHTHTHTAESVEWLCRNRKSSQNIATFTGSVLENPNLLTIRSLSFGYNNFNLII